MARARDKDNNEVDENAGKDGEGKPLMGVETPDVEKSAPPGVMTLPVVDMHGRQKGVHEVHPSVAKDVKEFVHGRKAPDNGDISSARQEEHQTTVVRYPDMQKKVFPHPTR